MNSMGITFEEDEDKISTHEAQTARINNNLTRTNGNLPTVTIKIEPDKKNSIVISTTTLPVLHDDVLIVPKMEEKSQRKNDIGIVKTGNLIVNQLENYGYESQGEDIKQFKENFLSIDCQSNFERSSKVKSKSTNSIAVSKSPNKSNSHGSIFNYTSSNKMTGEANTTLDSSSESKAFSKSSLFPSFNFGRKYVSKSFNTSSTARNFDNFNGNCEKLYRKSTDLNFHA
jgi:hypothetical protein